MVRLVRKIFATSAATMSAAEKVSLKSSQQATTKSTKANVSFVKAVKALNNIFGREDSLSVSLRYQSLKVSKEESESYADFGARVNVKC
jgi:biopolymer transport protein ExbD